MKLFLLSALLFFTSIFFGQNLVHHLNDFAPDEPDSIIAQRLATIESDVPLAFNKHVRPFIDFYTIKKRDYMRRMISKKDLYFPIFEKYLAKYNMPEDIKYLSIVESALNPRAESRVGAVGLWQFMPRTGESLKLNQDYFIDQRRDIERSTEAACKYLSEQFATFKDWELAIAAYNCGPGNIRKAKRRSGKNTFWGVYNYLPRETRGYVPSLIAVIYACRFADEHNLFPDTAHFPIETDNLEVSNYFNFEEFAKTLNICLDDLMDLNPSVKHNVIPDYIPSFTITYPADKTQFINSNSDLIAEAYKTRREKDKDVIKPVPNRIYHRIRSGETLGSIARKYRVYVSDIKRWNGLRSSYIYAGKKLIIYRKSTLYPAYSTSKAVVTASTKKTIKQSEPSISNIKSSPCSRRYHTVKSGDTLWSITQLYSGLTISKLKKINGLYSSRIYKGQKLKICKE